MLRKIISEKCGNIQIKGGYFAKITDGKLLFYKKDIKSQNPAGGHFCVPFGPGLFKSKGFDVTISVLSKNELKNFKNINKQYFKYTLDCDKIIGKAVIRSRIQGEGYYPAGRGTGKSLKKLFNEAGIPVEDRDFLPVISDQNGIAWVYGFGADERCKVTDETQKAFFIRTNDMGG